MAKRRSKPKQTKPADLPEEIPMTDLGWSEEDADKRPPGHRGDPHAVGTPGGGTASGGLAGTNAGDGDPDNVDLEDAMGSGIHDDEREDKDQPPYAGPAGGAVGGTPAEKRAKGGHERGGIKPGGIHRGDSTIGSSPSGPTS